MLSPDADLCQELRDGRGRNPGHDILSPIYQYVFRRK
jgi:hypothetical protein